MWRLALMPNALVHRRQSQQLSIYPTLIEIESRVSLLEGNWMPPPVGQRPTCIALYKSSDRGFKPAITTEAQRCACLGEAVFDLLGFDL